MLKLNKYWPLSKRTIDFYDGQHLHHIVLGSTGFRLLPASSGRCPAGHRADARPLPRIVEANVNDFPTFCFQGLFIFEGLNSAKCFLSRVGGGSEQVPSFAADGVLQRVVWRCITGTAEGTGRVCSPDICSTVLGDEGRADAQFLSSNSSVPCIAVGAPQWQLLPLYDKSPRAALAGGRDGLWRSLPTPTVLWFCNRERTDRVGHPRKGWPFRTLPVAASLKLTC